MPYLPDGYLPDGFTPPGFMPLEVGGDLPITAEAMKEITDLLGAADVDVHKMVEPERDTDPVSAHYAMFRAANILFDQVDQQPDPEKLIGLALVVRNQKKVLEQFADGFLAQSCRSLDTYIKQTTGENLMTAYEGLVDWSADFEALWERVID